MSWRIHGEKKPTATSKIQLIGRASRIQLYQFHIDAVSPRCHHCGNELPNFQNALRTIHFCDEIEEVSASAVKEINCETVLHDLEHTLRQLKEQGCPIQERVVWQKDDEDTSVYTRHLGFKVEKKLHLTPIVDVTWQCNTSAGKWCTFVSGFMSCPLLDKVLSSFLSGGNISVQGEGGARRFTDPAFSWQYAHELRFEITRTCAKSVFL